MIFSGAAEKRWKLKRSKNTNEWKTEVIINSREKQKVIP